MYTPLKNENAHSTLTGHSAKTDTQQNIIYIIFNNNLNIKNVYTIEKRKRILSIDRTLNKTETQ